MIWGVKHPRGAPESCSLGALEPWSILYLYIFEYLHFLSRFVLPCGGYNTFTGSRGRPVFEHGLLVLLDRLGCHFGGQWDPEGVPKTSFWGPNRQKRLRNALCTDFLCSWIVLGAILGATGIQRESQTPAFGNQTGTRGSRMVFRRGVKKMFEKREETRSQN